MAVVRSGLPTLAVALAACSFDGRVSPGTQCGTGGFCPEGQMCVDGFCVVAPGAAIDGSVADAPIDGEVPQARCGTISLLEDDFEDGSFDWRWDVWDEPGAVVVETGGAVEIDLEAGTLDAWAGVSSARWYDLRDGAYSAEVIDVGGESTVLEIRDLGDVAAHLTHRDGVLEAAVYGKPDDGVRVELTYDPAMHRFWRMREEDGRLYWETSSDRGTWTSFHDEALPLAPEHVRGILAIGGQQPSATEGRFGDVNLGSAAGLAYCPASDLVDDFDDGVLAPLWDPYTDVGCTALEVAGGLSFGFAAGATNADCGIQSEHLHDVRNSALTVEAVGMPADPAVAVYIQVQTAHDSETRIEIEFLDGELDVEQQVAGADVSAEIVPYDPVAHRWWRIRGTAGRIYLETSPDGADWTVLLEDDAAFDLSALRLEVGAGTGDLAPASPLMVRFDRVN
jgi:hypothetical protein